MELEENINNNSNIIFNKNRDINMKLINLIMDNNLIFDYHFPLLIEKSYKELSFLNNKKNSFDSSLKKIDENEIEYNKKEKFSNFYKNEIFQKFLNKTKNNNEINITGKSFSNNIDNGYSNYKVNSDNLNKLYKIENCNFIEINTKSEKLNNPIIKIDINEEINNHTNYIKENDSKCSFNKKDNFGNDIKVKKNRKMVFMNKGLLKPKFIKTKNTGENSRKSRYRGVSRNGNKWQTIISSKHFKGYIGIYPTEEIAARVYDIISIKNKGIKAKTNFKYNVHQIQTISEENLDFRSKDIESIISNLIKK